MHIQSLRGVSAVCSFEEILTSFWHKRGCERDMHCRGLDLTRCNFQFSRASTGRAEAACTDIRQVCVFVEAGDRSGLQCKVRREKGFIPLRGGS